MKPVPITVIPVLKDSEKTPPLFKKIRHTSICPSYLWQLESLWMYLKLQLADCSCCVNGRQLIIRYLMMNCLWWLKCFSMGVPITINKYTKNYCTVIGPIDLFVKIIYLLTVIKILYLRHRTLIKIVSSSL